MSESRKSATTLKADSDKHGALSPESDDRRASRVKERPQRGPDSDTLEGPGTREEAKREGDGRNRTTRRGEG